MSSMRFLAEPVPGLHPPSPWSTLKQPRRRSFLNMNDLQRRQVEETQYREDRSKASWAMMHAEAEAGRVTAFHIDDMKHQRLHSLKEQVADWAIGCSRAAAHIRTSHLVRWCTAASRGAPLTRARRSHVSVPPPSFSGG